MLELPDMLRRYGVEPVEVAGWKTRGNEFPTRPDGGLRHWTVGSSRLGIPSLQVLTYGRSDLPGPLCQVGQERSADGNDRAYVIASGKANHAGDGLWNGIRGNYKLLGLEIEWTGPNEAFSSRRRDVSERIMRALLDCCTGTNDDDVAEHREYALPPGRKIDTNLDGNVLRRRMRELKGATPSPTPPEENDMAVAPHSYWRRHDSNAVYKVPWGAPYKVHMPNPDSLAVDSYLMAMGGFDVKVNVVDQPNQLAWFEGLPVLRSVADPETLAEHLENSDDLKAAIAKAVVAALPPASTGGISEAQVEAAAERAIAKQLGFLKPGQ